MSRAAVGKINSAGRAGTVIDQDSVSRLTFADKRGRRALPPSVMRTPLPRSA